LETARLRALRRLVTRPAPCPVSSAVVSSTWMKSRSVALGVIAIAGCALLACHRASPAGGGPEAATLESDSAVVPVLAPANVASDAALDVEPVIAPVPVDADEPAEAPQEPDAPTVEPEQTCWCAVDSNCGWNDPCVPTFCTNPGVARAAECDKSLPPPGKCRCVDRLCTLQRFERAAGDSRETGCERHDQCALEREAGLCTFARFGAEYHEVVSVEGPYCVCNFERKKCTWHWADPVPCATDEDCTIGRSGEHMRPVRATRRRDRDGSEWWAEFFPFCLRDRVCAIGDGEVP